jgi:hypothetical protein
LLWIVLNSKYGATMSQYAATKIAHINSQCKLATLRRENRKIRDENEI